MTKIMSVFSMYLVRKLKCPMLRKELHSSLARNISVRSGPGGDFTAVQFFLSSTFHHKIAARSVYIRGLVFKPYHWDFDFDAETSVNKEISTPTGRSALGNDSNRQHCDFAAFWFIVGTNEGLQTNPNNSLMLDCFESAAERGGNELISFHTFSLFST